jgi:hypothetical protein
MSVVRYDFCMKQGAKHSFKLDKKDGFGNPKSLVNYLGKIKIKKRHSDLEIIGEAPIVFLDAPNGKMEIVVPKTMFNNVTVVNASSDYKDTFVYDLYLYKLDGVNEIDEDPLLEGTIIVSAKV